MQHEIWIHLIGVIVVLSFVRSVFGICPDPGGVSNGDRTITTNGTVVTYTCQEGFRLSEGTDVYTRVKGPDNSCWNGTTPFCNKIDCGDPGTVVNSVREGNEFLYNNELVYRCNYGFRMQDLSRMITITCLSTGSWDKERSTVSCTKVKCPPLVAVSKGAPPQETYYYGDVVTYPCMEGYRRIANSTILNCQETGYWNGSYPQCEAVVCVDPGEPENSQRISMSGLQYGDTVKYKCMEGYNPFPHENALSRKCETRGWTNAGLKCQGVLCAPKEDVHNSTHTPTTWRYPETVTFTCDPGFQAWFEGNQNNEITCQRSADKTAKTGIWDYEPISCERVICTDTGEAVSAELTTVVYRFTDVKVYKCLGGFVNESGNMTRKCAADGRFSGIAPTCIRVGCADPGEYDNSNRTVSGFLFGDIISYSCFNGYIVGNRSGVLDQKALCTNAGTWNPPLERCKAAVCGQPESQGLKIIGDNFQYPNEVTFECKAGYKAQDPTDMKRRCQANGLWNGYPPLCTRRSCGDPGKVSFSQRFGTQYTFESDVSYQCDPGYIIVTGMPWTLTCTANGTWSSVKPVCEPLNCPTPEAIDNAHLPIDYDTKYEANIEYLCEDGFAKLPDSGPLERTCEATGAWSGKPPVCDRISCKHPGTVDNTYLTGSSYLYGDKVNYSCVLGYTAEFRVTYKIKTCNEEGKWLGENITCETINCKNPGVKNAKIQKMEQSSKKKGFVFDTTVKYSCEDGFMISGQKELYCHHTGLWNGDVPDCVPIPVVEVGPEVKKVESKPVEAPDAIQYGLVGMSLMAIECGTLVLLDLLTISKDLKMLARNILSGWRRLRPKVAPKKDVNPPPLTDADLDLYLNESWANRVNTPSGMSYDAMSSSTGTLQNINGSQTDLVPGSRAFHLRPSTAARRLQILAGFNTGQATTKGDKKKKIITS